MGFGPRYVSKNRCETRRWHCLELFLLNQFRKNWKGQDLLVFGGFGSPAENVEGVPQVSDRRYPEVWCNRDPTCLDNRNRHLPRVFNDMVVKTPAVLFFPLFSSAPDRVRATPFYLRSR